MKTKQSAKQKSSKNKPKNKQISIKTSPKTSNPQVFIKNASPLKNKPKFAGKPQGWRHWGTSFFNRSDWSFNRISLVHSRLLFLHRRQCEIFAIVVCDLSWEELTAFGFVREECEKDFENHWSTVCLMQAVASNRAIDVELITCWVQFPSLFQFRFCGLWINPVIHCAVTTKAYIFAANGQAPTESQTSINAFVLTMNSMNFRAGCKQLTRSRNGCLNCVTNASHLALNLYLSSHYFPCVYAWHDLCGVNFSCGSTASSSCETSLPTSEYYECFCASALCSNCRKALLEIMLYRR